MEEIKQKETPILNKAQQKNSDRTSKANIETTSSYYDYSDEIELMNPVKKLGKSNHTMNTSKFSPTKKEKYQYLSQLIEENQKLQEEILELKQKQLSPRKSPNIRTAKCTCKQTPRQEKSSHCITPKIAKIPKTVQTDPVYHKSNNGKYLNILELIDNLLEENKQLKIKSQFELSYFPILHEELTYLYVITLIFSMYILIKIHIILSHSFYI